MKKLRVAGYLWLFAHDSVRKTIQFSQVTGTKKCPGLLGKTHLLDIPFWALRCFLVLRLGSVNKTITYVFQKCEFDLLKVRLCNKGS